MRNETFENKSSLQKRNRVVVKDLSSTLENDKSSSFVFIENNPVMVSFLSVLFIPYILGMLLTLVLFYFYVGVSVTEFFHVYSGLSQLVFWVLGIYLIITVVDFWLLLRKLFSKF